MSPEGYGAGLKGRNTSHPFDTLPDNEAKLVNKSATACGNCGDALGAGDGLFRSLVQCMAQAGSQHADAWYAAGRVFDPISFGSQSGPQHTRKVRIAAPRRDTGHVPHVRNGELRPSRILVDSPRAIGVGLDSGGLQSTLRNPVLIGSRDHQLRSLKDSDGSRMAGGRQESYVGWGEHHEGGKSYSGDAHSAQRWDVVARSTQAPEDVAILEEGGRRS